MSDHCTIERLHEETRTRLRSTQILTSLAQIVSELLQNSLDANAAHIDIGVDCAAWMCWVRDDGDGISKDGLEMMSNGDESSRYNTSKNYNLRPIDVAPTFGFRGEALASAGDVSCLEICSRSSQSRNTWSIIVKGGKRLYFGPAVRWKRESSGTTVCVRDAFFGIPVRRLSHPTPSRTMELIGFEMETYSLMFPHVSFTLENCARSCEAHQRKDPIVRIPQSMSTLARFRHLYGHALTEHIEEIYAVSEAIKVEGFISLVGAPSRIYQFLYINRHPVPMSELGRVIDSIYSLSSFGKNALDEDGENDLPRSKIRRSPRKLERKPVYVLNISISPEAVDNCMGPSKNVVQIHSQTNLVPFLSAVIRGFLEKHGFLSQKDVRNLRPQQSASPRKRAKLDCDQDDNGYHEVRNLTTASTADETEQTAYQSQSAMLYASPDGPGEEVHWLDSATRETFLIDSRTGNSIRLDGQAPDMNSLLIPIPNNRRTLRQLGTTDLVNVVNVTTVDADPDVPPWLSSALENNQVYSVTENRIPSIPVPNGDNGSSDKCHTSGHTERFRLKSLEASQQSNGLCFLREDLCNAQVISQVDRKFIACRIAKRSNIAPNSHDGSKAPSCRNSVLVLVDQHAADERIRVERFLKELCSGFLDSEEGSEESDGSRGVRVKELAPAKAVLLTRHEALTIKKSQQVRQLFRRWGIRIESSNNEVPGSDDASDSGRSDGYWQLLVSTIPEIVSDKLLQGDELRDFIKGFLGQIQAGELHSDSSSNPPCASSENELRWLKAVRCCPRGLLELINSKACRGAIMFNDSLSTAQCEKLIKQLSETVFPFQCAHGRPSLVPLVETESVGRRMRKPQTVYKWDRLHAMGGT